MIRKLLKMEAKDQQCEFYREPSWEANGFALYERRITQLLSGIGSDEHMEYS